MIEGQFLSMRAHAERFGMPSPPKRLIATGGASANTSILNSVASIFGCNVYKVQSPGKYSCNSFNSDASMLLPFSHPVIKQYAFWLLLLDYSILSKLFFIDSASMGAALRAAHGWLCNKKGEFVPISSLYMEKLDKTSLNCTLAATGGDENLVSKYTVLMKKRMEIENRLVEKLGRK